MITDVMSFNGLIRQYSLFCWPLHAKLITLLCLPADVTTGSSINTELYPFCYTY